MSEEAVEVVLRDWLVGLRGGGGLEGGVSSLESKSFGVWGLGFGVHTDLLGVWG